MYRTAIALKQDATEGEAQGDYRCIPKVSNS